MNITEHRGQRIYLASPYSHDNPLIVSQRADHVFESTANLVEAGIFVFSPIVYCHSLSRKFSLPGDFDYWKAYNWVWMVWANQLWIDAQDGWDESSGVQSEINFADILDKPVFLYHQENDELEDLS